MRINSEDQDLEVQAAWLYYVHGLGQEKIARRLSVSRTKVVRLLSRARETGLVKISIEHQMAESLALGDWIAKNYELDSCILTPPVEDVSGSEEQIDAIRKVAVGHVAAQELSRRILKQNSIVVGIGPGMIVRKTIESMRILSRPDARFVQLIGSSHNDDGSSAYALALEIAKLTEGVAVTLPAPFYLSDPSVPPMLRKDASIRKVLEMTAKTSTNLISCSSVGVSGSFYKLSEDISKKMKQANKDGAVCEIAGLLLDENGNLAKCDLNECRIGIGYRELKQANNILVAAGSSKIEPIKSALKAGIPNCLIVDHEIALGLVKAKTNPTI